MGSLDEGANQEVNDRQDDQDWRQSEFPQGTHPGPLNHGGSIHMIILFQSTYNILLYFT